jgi:hypothetical protein
MRSIAGAIALMLFAAAGVAATQPRLARTAHEVKARGDVVAFPPPDELRASLLGWNSAAVDVLWSTLLVAYGQHFSEHREFTEIPRYVDAILALEPTYAPLYKYVDTMLAYRPLQGTEQDAILARGYLARGMKERPQDWRVWMKYGQFLAYVGPSFLTKDADREAWRRDGAEAIEHAVELGADADSALTASALLTRAGATREAVRYLENAYAFTEHPAMRQVHEAIGRKLQALAAASQRDALDATARRVDTLWQTEMPAVSRDGYLLLGPARRVARCAGAGALGDRDCARGFAALTAEPGSSASSP